MSRARSRRAAVAVAALLPLSACGIQETDVIEAGGPATVEAFFNRNYDMLLFFHTPDGALHPVVRKTASSIGFGPDYEVSAAQSQEPVPTEKIILALLAGPRPEDRSAGLETSLPSTPLKGPLSVKSTPTGQITTLLPIPLTGLDTTALRQLTCTIAHNETPNGRPTVHLTGQDGTSTSSTCDLTPDPTGTTPPTTDG
ncbi:hypothetical protein [Streptomyces sp. NPDC018693]|uniref:hypothetical protein n=1 Tax=unclassified Streptomyces TaxID=2593676 RepID=UPI003795737B